MNEVLNTLYIQTQGTYLALDQDTVPGIQAIREGKISVKCDRRHDRVYCLGLARSV